METNTKTTSQQIISHHSPDPHGQWQLEITLLQQNNPTVHVHPAHHNPSSQKQLAPQNTNTEVEAAGFILEMLVVEYS